MIILDYLGETSIITKTPLEGSTGVRVREGDGKTKAEVEVMRGLSLMMGKGP